MSDNPKAIGSITPSPGQVVLPSTGSAAFVPSISAKPGIAAIYDGLAKQGLVMERPK